MFPWWEKRAGRGNLFPGFPFMYLLTGGENFIVRMFRLRPASSESQRLFFLLLFLALGALLTAVAIHYIGGALRRRKAREKSLQGILSAARLNSAEKEAFDRIVQNTGDSAPDCATSVEAFDRGVEEILRVPAGDLERVDRLRTLRALRKKLSLHTIRPGVPVVSTRTLPPNQPLQIYIPGLPRMGGSASGTLLSTNEEALTIRLDGNPRELAGIFRGLKDVEVVFINPLDASYTFRSPVMAFRELGAAFLVLAHPSRLTRIQKRNYARVEVEDKVQFRWIPELEMPALARTPGKLDRLIEEYAGVIRSISGGGFRLETELLLERGDFIYLQLAFLPEPINSEHCFARVVRNLGKRIHGLRFEGMSPNIQSTIIQFVRHRERKRIELEREREAGGTAEAPPGTSSPSTSTSTNASQ